MLVQLDQVIDRGFLTVAPTAAARGWDIEWLRRWLRDPARPPARAAWTLVPDFREAIARSAGRCRNRVGDRLLPYRWRRHGGPEYGSLKIPSRSRFSHLYSPHENQGPAGLS